MKTRFAVLIGIGATLALTGAFVTPLVSTQLASVQLSDEAVIWLFRTVYRFFDANPVAKAGTYIVLALVAIVLFYRVMGERPDERPRQ